MRRQWYLGLGLLLLVVFLLFAMWHDIRWFFLMLVPLIGLWFYDITQTKHTILRNFPVMGHMRYILEFFRPEIQQYFIADDEEERPFNREIRSLIYQRAKNIRDTVPFGTERDILEVGYTWVEHSLAPKVALESGARVLVGGADCKQPYEASRLNISAMSFGALSENAIMALNQGAQLGGFAHNTGEGGLSTHHLQGGDLIFQLGTAYFGCRDDEGRFDEAEFQIEAKRPEVKMIEIKLSQGAKPSHGGILPAVKLTPEIARVRKVSMGHDVISPAAHTAFNSPKGLIEFVARLRDLSGGKPVGFKLCVGQKSEFLGICKAMIALDCYPDFITVDGAEGGTGAAPLEYTNRMGEPLESALIFVHNALVGTGLRDKMRIICSGKITTGFNIIAHLAMGADLCNAARTMMMAIGCVQSKQCHANTCPTGIATQDKRLQKGLVVEQKKHRVMNFHKNTMKSFLELLGSMGLESPDELTPAHVIRRVDYDVVKPFSEAYLYLEPGQLLGKKIPDGYRKYWDAASADKF
ncbi:MAG: FMN-binding glutamate synthase family protein [Gammaproteobacteria bacterium]|nr:FMN-binding glutamate synthase family protein [Gammaproteobacteria bacterium]